jgi:hypothetical protein
MMTPKELAQQIAALLFTTGNGQKAKRLVLIDEDGRDLGGWGERPVADLIEDVLTGRRKPAKKGKRK